MKDQISKIFEGANLSEDAIIQISTLFDAAVSEKVRGLEASISEQYAEQLEAEKKHLNEMADAYGARLVEEFNTEVDRVKTDADVFVKSAVNSWINENAEALKNVRRNTLVESFVADLRELFVNHRIDIPESEIDAIANMQEEIKQRDEKMQAQTDRIIALGKELNEAQKAIIFASETADLTSIQRDRLHSLSESIHESDLDVFKQKLATLKESVVTVQSEGHKPEVTQTVLPKPLNESETQRKITPATKTVLAAAEALNKPRVART
jgi:hypothetical protein